MAIMTDLEKETFHRNMAEHYAFQRGERHTADNRTYTGSHTVISAPAGQTYGAVNYKGGG